MTHSRLFERENEARFLGLSRTSWGLHQGSRTACRTWLNARRTTAQTLLGKAGAEVSAAWLLDGRDYPLPEYIYPLSDGPPSPPGPRLEGSFSDRFTFATHEDMDRFKYPRIERGPEVLIDRATGQEGFVSGGW